MKVEGISSTTQNLLSLLKSEKIIRLKKTDSSHKLRRLDKIFDELKSLNLESLDVFSNDNEIILLSKDYKIKTFLI
jgi:hypothetical protein